MTLPVAFLDELRGRLSVSSVVGRRVKLTRSGREFQGLCPFHNEKSPSFTVNDDKGFWHCFGCGSHGDIIGFEMRAGALTFLDAVERLAADAGLEVPKAERSDPEADRRAAGLMEALEAAAVFFAAELRGAGGVVGLEYLRGRGLTEDTIDRFRLGWAPPGWDGLKRALMGARFPEALLLEAGLIRRGERGDTFDMFRGRVVFPITDRRGRVIAFGARALDDTKPKYLNSPDSPVFDKGSTLYGLAHAREGAAAEGSALAVEGYMDVISLHQARLAFAVAPLGTALTERHFDALWRLSPAPVLCLDGDAAGQKAMERAADRAFPHLTPERTLRFATLPADHDPDSLIRSGGADAVRAVLAEARGIVDVVWDSAARRIAPTSPERLAAFEREVTRKAASIADVWTRRAVLGEFQRRRRVGFAAANPVTIGRGARLAPSAAAACLETEWKAAVTAAESGPVRGWLEKQGIAWDVLVAVCGGIGFARAKVTKGRVERLGDGADGPVSLWEPAADGVGLVILPAWEGLPADGVPADLIGWDVRADTLHSRTGAAVVLGAAAVDEALAFEVDGFGGKVEVASGALVWLRRLCEGENPVLVVDWRRAWDALGGLSGLVADSVELGERLDKHVRPPPLFRPAILLPAGA